MTRILALLSSAALLAAAAHAQCPQATNAGLVNWDAFSGYASTFGAADEGIAAVALPFSFPMPGYVGTLDQMWVNSNGEIYLADSAAGLLAPTGAASYGMDGFAELQGALGSLPRIACLGDDHESSAVAGSNWSVTVDTSVAGQATVTWVDMARYLNATDRFSFQATLFASGTVQFDYGTTIPGDIRFVGISVGNLEPSTSGSQDLTTLPASTPTEGILYQAFTAATWDLAGQTVLIVPDFTPGIENYSVAAVVPYAPGTCASHVAAGTGCHSFVGPDLNSSLFQLFAGSPAAKAALDGNALQFTLTGSGYTATWLPGVAAALYVAPVTPTAFPANDDITSTFSPSSAIPIPGGLASTWTMGPNGILTAGAVGNQGSDFTPSLAETATATGLAFYTWRDWNPAESGSNPVVWEEIGGVLYVTWNSVEAYGTPSPNPGTFQFQVNMTTGDVTIVWVSFEGSTSTASVVVGCTLAGAGPTPTSVTLSTATPFVMAPPVSLSPMGLSAAPRPIINPSTLVTYTATNLPEFIPGSGIYLSTMFLSVTPIPAFPLTGILTTVPGCNAYIGTLDLDLGAQLTLTPAATWSFTFDNVVFGPGNVIAAQAVALFDSAFPLVNGEAGGFLVSNGVVSTTELQ